MQRCSRPGWGSLDMPGSALADWRNCEIRRRCGSSVATQFFVDAQKLRDCRRVPAAKAALSGDVEISNVPLGSSDPPSRALDAIGVVYETENKACGCRQGKHRERSKVGIVCSIARHRHMHEGDRSRRRPANAVGEGNTQAKILRLYDMLVSGVTIAKVDTKLGGGADRAAKAPDPLDRARDRVSIKQLHAARSADDFVSYIPLDAEALRGDRALDELDFVCHGPLNGGRDSGAVALGDEPADERRGRRQRDLKPCVGGNFSFAD